MDAQDIMEFARKASYAFAIIAGIIVIALIWYKITGHSPEALDLVLVFQGVTMAAIFGMAYRQGKLEEKMDEFNKKFGLLATDFKALQGDVRNLQSDFKLIRIEAKAVKTDISEIKRIVSKKRAA